MPLNPILANVIIIAVLAAIVGGIVYYLYRAKKRGDKCIGCPYSKQCSSHNCQKK
ncbi:MAG: FeoB-associated Cys-rich membrane protein [Oscillospiraceae bacterium]